MPEISPVAESATHITVLGVLEYIYDLPTFLHRLRVYARPVVLSYNPTDLTGSIDWPVLGWVNHLGFMELERALRGGAICNFWPANRSWPSFAVFVA